jgi:hypothetical protein
MASVTDSREITGNAPGRPMQTGQMLVLGSSPKWFRQPQKIFVFVRS